MIDTSFISLFAISTPDLSDGLQRLTQLVILMIPLFLLPTILKSSNNIIGKIGNIADNVSRQLKVDAGVGKVSQGIGKGARAYGNVGRQAITKPIGGAAGRASRWAGRGIRNANWMQNANGDPRDFSKISAGASYLRPKNIRGAHRAVLMTNEATKAAKDQAINEKAYNIISTSGDNQRAGGVKGALTGNLARVGGTPLVAQAGAAAEEAEKKRVQGVYAMMKFSNAGLKELSDALRGAIASGDHATASAAILRLNESGARGVMEVGESLAATPTTNAAMQTTIEKALNEASNYGAQVSKDASTVKRGSASTYDTSGNFVRGDLSSVSADQLSSQTATSLSRNFTSISVVQAQEIMANPTLRAKIVDDKARDIIEARANGNANPHTGASILPPL
jgi:hypothetical protein